MADYEKRLVEYAHFLENEIERLAIVPTLDVPFKISQECSAQQKVIEQARDKLYGLFPGLWYILTQEKRAKEGKLAQKASKTA